jgi:glyoxylase-like metal-dependent hydrolase (beta-lactamase superfamily II)
MRGVIDRRQLLQWCGCAALGRGLAWSHYADAAEAADAAGSAAAATLPPMVPREVGPGCWYVEGLSALGSPANQNFISNAGFVVTPGGVVVVDALGSPALARRLLAEIARITPQKVTHVVLTHYHADHVYGLQVFEQAGARIIAHEAGREYLHADTARLRLQASRDELAPWIDAQTRLVAATEWVQDRRELTVGGRPLVLQPVGPAHTPEDLAVFVPDAQVLYAGDLVFRSRIPFVGQADSRQWISSLDRLLTLGAKVVVPGHGPMSTEAAQDMRLTRDYLAYLRRTMGEAARDMTPFDDAYRATDWSAFEHLPLFGAANRMNAYNTYLLMEQEKP